MYGPLANPENNSSSASDHNNLDNTIKNINSTDEKLQQSIDHNKDKIGGDFFT